MKDGWSAKELVAELKRLEALRNDYWKRQHKWVNDHGLPRMVEKTWAMWEKADHGVCLACGKFCPTMD